MVKRNFCSNNLFEKRKKRSIRKIRCNMKLSYGYCTPSRSIFKYLVVQESYAFSIIDDDVEAGNLAVGRGEKRRRSVRSPFDLQTDAELDTILKLF